jgi:hypothetical protein
VVLPCVHCLVQKFDLQTPFVQSPMVEQIVAPEFPRQSGIPVQYLPTPSELPVSPGCPQCDCSRLSPDASRGPLSAWPEVPLEEPEPELPDELLEPEVPDELLVPEAPEELLDEPLVPELLLVPEEPDDPELEEELHATIPMRPTMPAITKRFILPSHRQPGRFARCVRLGAEKEAPPPLPTAAPTAPRTAG